jgi:hypothetical protein
MKKSKAGYSRIQIEMFTPQGNAINQPLHYKSTGCKYFFCSQHLTFSLSNKERSFYDFLCEKMDADNAILINKYMKEEYIDFMKKVCSKDLKITIATLDKALAKLKEKMLLIHLNGGAGYYLVNPRYAYKGKEADRMRLLKKIIQNRMLEGLSLDGLIDIPENEFTIGLSLPKE